MESNVVLALQYLDVARTMKYYGYLKFQRCTCDFPTPGTPVLISAGNRELNFRLDQVLFSYCIVTCPKECLYHYESKVIQRLVFMYFHNVLVLIDFFFNPQN